MAARETPADTATEVAESNEKKALGPRPAHILLESISRALSAGVDRTQILTLVDMARMARGVEQAPVWKMVAANLDTYTAAANGAKPQVS